MRDDAELDAEDFSLFLRNPEVGEELRCGFVRVYYRHSFHLYRGKVTSLLMSISQLMKAKTVSVPSSLSSRAVSRSSTASFSLA
jgi:hypothetical protein